MSCPNPSGSLREYIQPYWRRLFFVVVLSLAGTVLSLALPFVSKALVDEALLGRNWHALLKTVALFSVLTLVSYAVNVWSGLKYTRVSAEILFEMRLALYRHLQQMSPRFWARTRLGDVVSRLNNDISEIQRVAAETALAWVGNVLFLVGSVAMMLWLDARLFLLSIASVPLSVWALKAYRLQLESRAANVRTASASIGTFLIETLSGMRLVVTSNAQEREAGRFRDANDSFIGALMAMQRASYLSGGLPGLILTAGSSLVFLYGGWLVIQGAITMGTLVAFLAYQMRLMSPVQALMGLWTNLAVVKVSLRRVQELMHMEPEIREAPDALALTVVRGEIRFENVTFSFDRGGPVLENLSLLAEPGETVAIIGPSGSGKSTIADLLLRLLDPDSGVVRLDGRDLRTLRLSDLRKHVITVEQEPFLLHASIAENLRYLAPKASREELESAAADAAIHDFISGLPEGYDTVVGERGFALSAGERQRIALARAFLANPSVLILDEPTSALDPATEQRILEGYERRMAGRTVIVITHRMEVARRLNNRVHAL